MYSKQIIDIPNKEAKCLRPINRTKEYSKILDLGKVFKPGLTKIDWTVAADNKRIET